MKSTKQTRLMMDNLKTFLEKGIIKESNQYSAWVEIIGNEDKEYEISDIAHPFNGSVDVVDGDNNILAVRFLPGDYTPQDIQGFIAAVRQKGFTIKDALYADEFGTTKGKIKI